MKSYSLTFALLAFSASSLFSQPAPLQGSKLDISTAAQSIVINSGAIGSGNIVDSAKSMAVGTGNRLASFYPDEVTGNSFAVGTNNIVATKASASVGMGNSVYGISSMAIGSENAIIGSYEETFPPNCLALGYRNYILPNCQNILVVGRQNVATGGDGIALIGTGLTNVSNATLFGRFNDVGAFPYPSKFLAFAIGIGTSANDRANAFEVYTDGTIVMPVQGDISMGEFAP